MTTPSRPPVVEAMVHAALAGMGEVCTRERATASELITAVFLLTARSLAVCAETPDANIDALRQAVTFLYNVLPKEPVN